MKIPIKDRGHNVTYLQNVLLNKMDPEDVSRLVSKAKELVERLPESHVEGEFHTGLLLGLIQSGKTYALTTSIALAADNDYRFFIVLTTDNNWLYGQTKDRLQSDLQRLMVETKTSLDGVLHWQTSLQPSGHGLVLLVSKNQNVLQDLLRGLDSLRGLLGDKLPSVLLIDDEADQASLDTQTSKRAKQPHVQPGRISQLISQIRQKFPSCMYLQVTATPQALFLQDTTSLNRPEFTILIEPGKGYVGGNTFFSLQWGRAEELIRYIQQGELDGLLAGANKNSPASLKQALATFFVGATIKCLLHQQAQKSNSSVLDEPKFSFLCHISQKKAHHQIAFNAIASYRQELQDAIVKGGNERARIENEFQAVYGDLSQTMIGAVPTFSEVFSEFANFINGTDIQILNSDKEEDYPRYNRRYNIFIGGTKLSRGVTIENLLVTYYGRQSKTTNMDTVLQHARMYGYREKHLDVTRLFLTQDIQRRFSEINESEQALRKVIETHPNEKYRVIRSGKGINPTRRNVLNPNNKGYFGAGTATFPHKPIFLRDEIEPITQQINAVLDKLFPSNTNPAIPVTLDQVIDLIRMTKSEPNGGGLWKETRIITALETLRSYTEYGNNAFLVVRRDRDTGKNATTGTVRAVLSGGEEDRLASPSYPTLFMFRQNGRKTKGWDDCAFWMPILRFPDGQFALEFNVSN